MIHAMRELVKEEVSRRTIVQRPDNNSGISGFLQPECRLFTKIRFDVMIDFMPSYLSRLRLCLLPGFQSLL